ncbi:MAG TPA: hypothetical protein PLO69_10990 [Gammaproteobacteria bacterium]|nr:hypothetical protein [Gammaproteobacteria bacterium]
MRGLKRVPGLVAGFLLTAIGLAIAGNVGPLMIQNYGADIDNPALFWTNIGGGSAGKLSIGAGLSNQAGALTVTLKNTDVVAALGYPPVNKAGDTMTGMLGFTASAAAVAAGTNQATATPITAQITVFTEVPPGTGGELSGGIGVPQTIYNRGANVLTLYPFMGAQIESFGVNSPVAVAVGGFVTIRCVSPTQCYTGV